MDLEIVMSGDRVAEASDEAEALYSEIAGRPPEITDAQDTDARRIDPATAIGIASLMMSLPGAVLATLHIRDRLDRRRLATHVQALKAKLEASDAEASLKLGADVDIDLRRTDTDKVVDRILEDAGR